MTGRNEDCRCGSGRKYKNCHLPIDEADGVNKYSASQAVYARNWRTTAQHHYDKGHYRWLAEQLAPYAPKRILDIGCGSGHGLVAMREVLGSDVVIVAIDENAFCLDVAAGTLRENGQQAQIVKRMTVSVGPSGFNHVAGQLSFDHDAATTLIEADVCNDSYLASALQASGSFDAVTIWLTGVHMMRQFNVHVRAKGVASDGDHRLYVQNASYELADSLLRPGGVLQVGDRAHMPDSKLLEDDILRAHGEQASVTSLEVKGLTYRPYDEPEHRRTPMGVTPGLNGIVPNEIRLALISVISEKP